MVHPLVSSRLAAELERKSDASAAVVHTEVTQKTHNHVNDHFPHYSYGSPRSLRDPLIKLYFFQTGVL